MAFTPEQETKLLQLIDAFDSGVRINELPEYAGDHPGNTLLEIQGEDGESYQAKVAKLYPKIGFKNLVSRNDMLNWNNVANNLAVYSIDDSGIAIIVDAAMVYNYISTIEGNDVFFGTKKYKENTQYSLKLRWRNNRAGNDSGMFIGFKYSDGTNSSIHTTQNTEEVTTSILVSEPGKTVISIWISFGSNVGGAWVYYLGLFEGDQTPLDEPIAVEDIVSSADNLIQGGSNTIETGEASNNSFFASRDVYIKPNQLYTFKCESILNISGEPLSYGLLLYNPENGAFLADSILISNVIKKALFVTKNTFTEGVYKLLFYAGVPGETLGNNIKYSNATLCEGNVNIPTYSEHKEALLTGNNTNYVANAAHALLYNTSDLGVKIKIPADLPADAMMVFTVRVYLFYKAIDIQFSGYLYADQNRWHEPNAIVLGMSYGNSVHVKMGIDDDGFAYVWIEGPSSFGGVAVLNVISSNSGYDFRYGWTISRDDNCPNLAFDKEIYRPKYFNE